MLLLNESQSEKLTLENDAVKVNINDMTSRET